MEIEVDFSEYFSLMQRTQALIEIERWDEAIKVISQALATYPDNHWFLCSLAVAQLNLGRTKNALESAERAVQVAPEAEWGHRLRSVILSRQGRKKEALAAARQAARLEPEQPETLYTLSQALLANEEWHEARVTAEKMRALSPEIELAHEALGLVALEQKRWSDAEDHFQEALKINPNSYQSLNNLGVALLNQGRDAEATERFHQAAALNPLEETARNNLKTTVSRFLPLTGAALLLFLKAFAFKVPFFVAWIALQMSRVFVAKDTGNFAVWLLGRIAVVGATVYYLFMLGSGLCSLRSSRFAHLPERLQNYIRMERARSWYSFRWNAIGGAALVILLWWGMFWLDGSHGEVAPQSYYGWLFFLTLCATTAASGVLLWRNRKRA